MGFATHHADAQIGIPPAGMGGPAARFLFWPAMALQSLWDKFMQQILYFLLCCYLLPLAGMIASAVTSRLFQTDSSLVIAVAAISGTFLEGVRTGLATLLIPIITAFAVELRHPDDDIPLKKLRLIRFLFAAFILSFP